MLLILFQVDNRLSIILYHIIQPVSIQTTENDSPTIFSFLNNNQTVIWNVQK